MEKLEGNTCNSDWEQLGEVIKEKYNFSDDNNIQIYTRMYEYCDGTHFELCFYFYDSWNLTIVEVDENKEKVTEGLHWTFHMYTLEEFEEVLHLIGFDLGEDINS